MSRISDTLMDRFQSPRVQTVSLHLRESAAVLSQVCDSCVESVMAAAELIVSAFTNGDKLLLCGNGGSAADCQHMAAELTSRLSADFARPGLPAIALTTDTSFLTAYANDFEFEGVFARQVQALGKQGDVLLGISTSGTSKNVLRAVQRAKQMGIQVIGLTGKPCRTGFEVGQSQCLADSANVAICVPSDNPQHIQEAHLAVEHIICHLVERALFGESGTADWEVGTRSEGSKRCSIIAT
jgi:D-sedoheptulose 7-phosphate isomerase